MNILIGADPEVFVRSKDTHQLISGHGLVPGDKKNPFKVPNGAVQVDGMALEFNIDPAATKEEFQRNIASVYHQLGQMVPDFVLEIEPYAEFSHEVLCKTPAEALVLGCDPDFNGWTGGQNVPPDGTVPYRTASGHVHIGWTNGKNSMSDTEHYAECCAMARQMDYYLGLYSLLWDGDNRRRALYGQAGAFRPKPYGMEYRVLSNVWLKDQALTEWVYESAHKGATDYFNGIILPEREQNYAEEMINSNCVDWIHSKGIIPEVGEPPVFNFERKVA